MMSLVIAPGAMILQLIGGILFNKWISGTMPFDPWLLSSMITGVVLSFGAFPSTAMVRSQNDFVCLTRVMVISAVALVLTMLILVPKFGARGAGFGLLAGELSLYILITHDAKRWVSKLNLIWPSHSFRLSQVSLVLTTLSLAALAYRPGIGPITLAVSMCLQAVVAVALFKDLPDNLKGRLLAKVGRKAA
jgi:O-antigen/teichoic acid export membrane protein